ncbi:MAG TPA: GDSL-type esterase/lipase family protein [Tepidisphaeraceae bacterium]|jgi:lysophospholipase L1-like esterase
MKHIQHILVLFLLAVAPFSTAQTAAPATARAAKQHNFARWDKAISAFEQRDKEQMPPKNGIVFIGSSTIALWKTLSKDFPDVPVINRGFGGSEIVDSTHFADRIIFPYEPKQVFLRAGGNDIHAGKSPQRVFNDFKAFVAKVHEKLPQTEVVYIAQCPAPVRWEERDKVKDLNDLVQAWVKDQTLVKYCETYDMTVTADGKPREDLFVQDRLHFNEEGYRVFAERIRPFLKQ